MLDKSWLHKVTYEQILRIFDKVVRGNKYCVFQNNSQNICEYIYINSL